MPGPSTRATRLWPLAAALLVGGGPSCDVNPLGTADIEAPNADLIYVFYPRATEASGGLVRGRGLPGAMPLGVSHAFIQAHPTLSERVVTVASDGSFDFEIIAISRDVLEIRGATSETARELGEATYVRVPDGVFSKEPFVCCAETTNTCQSRAARDAGLDCPDMLGLPTCQTDADCAIHEGQVLPLYEEDVTVTAPTSGGTVTVSGTVLPNVLVTMSNVGKSSVAGGLSTIEVTSRGLADPGVRRSDISGVDGSFSFTNVPAISDDEIIVQLQDLDGRSSTPYSLRVPDPPIAGVDILDVFPWEPLTNGQNGRVAIRMSPYGEDGRGICPDNPSPNDGLELCFGGGLDHAMVTAFSQATAEGEDLDPTRTSTDANLPFNRGVSGNVRSPPTNFVIVVDMSSSTLSKDPGNLIVPALRDYARYLRQRDRVGVVVYDGNGARQIQALTDDRDAVVDALNSLAGAARSGDPDPLAGARAAADILTRDSRGQPGRILLLTTSAPDMTRREAQIAALPIVSLVEALPSAGVTGFPTDVLEIGVDATLTGREAFNYLTTYSQGLSVRIDEASDLATALSDLRGSQVGTFTLLYDMDIPRSAGKSTSVSLTLEVTLPGAGSATGSYEGPLRIANAPNR